MPNLVKMPHPLPMCHAVILTHNDLEHQPAHRALAKPVAHFHSLFVSATTPGIPYVDDRGHYADFHALRKTFITNLSRVGVSPTTAQLLARHSDINLTMNTYTMLGHCYGTPQGNQLTQLLKNEKITPLEGVASEFTYLLDSLLGEARKKQFKKQLLEQLKPRVRATGAADSP